MARKSPDQKPYKPTPVERAEIQRRANEALMPAVLMGLVEVSGPVDEEDRERARKILEITDSRQALAAYFRQKAAADALEMAMSLAETRELFRFEIDEPTDRVVREQLRQIHVPSSPQDVSDEVWEWAQLRRRWAESIIAGVLPSRPGV